MKLTALVPFLVALLTLGSACSDPAPASDAGGADADAGSGETGPDADAHDAMAEDADAGLDTGPGADADRAPEDAGDDASADGGGDAEPTDDGGGDGGTADLHARLLYTNQRVFREDEFFARGGIARLEIYDPQELPADDRTELFNDDGERCTFESGSEWPETLTGGGTWPEAPFHDAGDLTLTVTGAPGPVVYEYFDSYYLRESPGPVVIEGITYNSFFSPDYLPHGAEATFSAAGGSGAPAFSFDGVQIADDYTVSAPNIVEGGDVIDTGAALTFSWSPGAPGDTMAIIVKDTFSFIKCRFADDGEGTVPAAAMSLISGGQFVDVTIQTWREHTQSLRAVADDGTAIDVELTSRHVQIGRFGTR